VTVVKYLDDDEVEQTLAPSFYRPVLKGRGDGVYFKEATYTLPVADGPGVVWIDYVAGFGQEAKDVPAQWRSLVAAVAYHMYERRGLVAGGGLDEAFERVVDRKVVLAGASRRYV
jgi:uncharacterized phiE125 gp8 family phage protein